MSNQEMGQLFAEVGACTRHFVQGCKRTVTMILLTGKRTSGRRFKKTLGIALGEAVPPRAMIQLGSLMFGVETEDSDLVFTIAKGAAKVAKRQLEALMQYV